MIHGDTASVVPSKPCAFLSDKTRVKNHCDRTKRQRLRALTGEFLRRAPARPVQRTFSSARPVDQLALQFQQAWLWTSATAPAVHLGLSGRDARGLHESECRSGDYRAAGNLCTLGGVRMVRITGKPQARNLTRSCSDSVAASQRDLRALRHRDHRATCHGVHRAVCHGDAEAQEGLCARSLRLWQIRQGLDVRP
jgi:hypothetical protein